MLVYNHKMTYQARQRKDLPKACMLREQDIDGEDDEADDAIMVELDMPPVPEGQSYRECLATSCSSRSLRWQLTDSSYRYRICRSWQ